VNLVARSKEIGPGITYELPTHPIWRGGRHATWEVR